VFVDLAPVFDPALTLNAIAQALGVLEDPGRPLVQTLTDHLRDRSLLVVLDNFEQIVAAGPDVTSLLGASADVRVLVTSREPLHTSWEHVYILAPLPLPGPGAGSDRFSLERLPATALFVQRARAANSHFSPGPSDAKAIIGICRRLDGLPLAIELAAVWTKTLQPETIRSRLEAGGAFSGGARHDSPERHRTLTRAIAWSYGLLSDVERAVFRRLAAFAGGCSFDAVEWMCSDLAVDVLAPIASLLDKNLLMKTDGGGAETRFRMLETIRQFAGAELHRSNEADGIQRRHAAWFLTLAERASRLLWSDQQAEWIERMDREHDNVRAALAWGLGGHDEEMGVELAGAMNRYWFVRGHFREARTWLEMAAAKDGVPPRSRVQALWALGFHLHVLGDAAAATIAHEAVAVARATGEAAASAHALFAAASAADNASSAEELFSQMLAEARRAGDVRLTARALANLSVLLQERGDNEGAQRVLEESLFLARQLQEKWLMSAVSGNVGLAIGTHDPPRAKALLRESLALAHESGHRWLLAGGLESLGWLLAYSESPSDAAILLGAAEGLREVIGSIRGKRSQSVVDRAMETARERLGQTAFDAAWRSGRAMSVEDAVATALGHPPADARPRARRPGGLTGREAQITGAVARGLTNREIAADLGISARTVDAHVQNILNKLGMSRRTQLAGWATTHLSSGTHS
jgi:non-specific serine/threonine protein kinase